MAVQDLILFIGDQHGFEIPTTVFTVDSTAAGYLASNAREADLVRAWKPSDTAPDHYLVSDGGSKTYLGATGALAALGIAYDARGSHQDWIRIQYDASDNPAFTVPVNLYSIQCDKNQVVCDYIIFTLPDNDPGGTNPPRYYRVFMDDADRTGGNVMPKVFMFTGHKRSDFIRLSTDYLSDAQGTHTYEHFYRSVQDETSGGVPVFNKYGAPGTRVTYSFDNGTSEAFWNAFVQMMWNVDGPKRAFLAQLTGPINPPKPGFFLVRMTNVLMGRREYPPYVPFQVQFETQPWF